MVFFIVHQFVDVIPCGISEFVHFAFVFLIAANYVVCNAYVKNAVSFVCFNVNLICFCVHSDYVWWYIVVFWFTSDFFVQAPRRPRNNSVGTRSFGRQADCGRALRMTSSFLQGLRPCTPFCECEQSVLDFTSQKSRDNVSFIGN